ncbi:MAG TPA: DUF3108 domain-containing protein [Gemmatimonadales bacterium]|nr:DUF3108 domain-containing protein [Gemmatimonadales bacterium]
MNGLGALAIALVQAAAPVAVPDTAVAPSWPFGVGEEFQYDAKLGMLKLGTGNISVVAVDTVRGVPSYHLRFAIDGGVVVFKINSTLESWVGTGDMISRRFHKDSKENDRVYTHHYEIYPDSGFTRENRDSFPTPKNPLDDAAFFFFIRTVPLEVGKTYRFNRYFHEDTNPVVVKVAKRESCDMPDGKKTQCLLLQPTVGKDGMFAPRAESQLWVTDDVHRVPVQLRTKFPFGTLTLKISSIKYAPKP